MERYKIVRHYFEGSRKRVIDRGLTEEEAQRHCQGLETSSSTCTGAMGKRLTKQQGPWFDGYEKE